MHPKRVVSGGEEIEKQLDHLMDPDSPTGISSSESKMENSSESILTSLKSIVLSMDWEINDSILNEFIQELNRLKAIFQHDRIVVKSLQLLEAIGKYILQKKARTHPDAIRLLQSIYRDLEILLLSKGISEAVRRNILLDEVAQFKKLKEKLTLPSRAMAGYLAGDSKIAATSADLPSSIVSDKERMPSLEAALYALEEIIRFIRIQHNKS
jgi:hypothetical protein